MCLLLSLTVLGRIFPLMRQNVMSGNSCWTNNNCESINHVLKQAVNWRPQHLPVLIDTLRQLVESQYTEADRAMCGVGDFVLRGSFVRHRLTDVSTASDGGITVPNTRGGGKKPHQRKRKRAEKTSSKVNRVMLGVMTCSVNAECNFPTICLFESRQIRRRFSN